MNSLRLLLDAAKHYESSPMLHYIELAIIKVEADLRSALHAALGRAASAKGNAPFFDWDQAIYGL